MSFRIVPHQDPDKVITAFRDWVAANTPTGIETAVKVLSAAPGLVVNPDHPAIGVAAKAFGAIFGRQTVFIRSGGSIPIVGDFANHLKIPTILMGFGLPDDGLHSPNEKFKIDNYYLGIRTVAQFLEDYGALTPKAVPPSGRRFLSRALSSRALLSPVSLSRGSLSRACLDTCSRGKPRVGVQGRCTQRRYVQGRCAGRRFCTAGGLRRRRRSQPRSFRNPKASSSVRLQSPLQHPEENRGQRHRRGKHSIHQVFERVMNLRKREQRQRSSRGVDQRRAAERDRLPSSFDAHMHILPELSPNSTGRVLNFETCGVISKVITLWLLLLTACNSSRERSPVIGEAFVGPSTVKIRADIPTQSATVATAKHGDRLAILQKRRTFLRIRTSSGVEGWTDERVLLSPSDMSQIRGLFQSAAALPTQGAAIPRFGDMRVYSQPSIASPSFLTVRDKERIDVLATLSVVRANQPRTPRCSSPRPKKHCPKEEGVQCQITPPSRLPNFPNPLPAGIIKVPKRTSLPSPATPPRSCHRLLEPHPHRRRPGRLDPHPPPAHGHPRRSGPILRRGKRIVSYFSLGKIEDKDKPHEVWLWTTVRDGVHPYDFDSIRVFTWSARRRHYETAHIESNLTGFQPVLVEPETVQAGKGRTGVGQTHAGFSVCVENKDGARIRREFVLIGETIRAAGERPCEPPVTIDTLVHHPPPAPAAPATPANPQTFGEKMKRRWRSLTGRFFKKDK